MAAIIDGKQLAETIRKEIAAGVQEFSDKYKRRPRLAAVLAGDDPASHVYVRNKVKACEQVGIESESHHLDASVTEDKLLGLLQKLNESHPVDGILLQLPLPKGLSKVRALDAIHPSKDVDGLHPYNAGLLVQARAALIACTPLGCIEALKRYDVPMAGADAVVLGRSDLVGKPVATLLMHENATVTVCHSKTKNLSEVVSRASIVVAAMGKAGFVTDEFIKPGAVIIDVGTTVLKQDSDVVEIFGANSKKVEDFRAGKTVITGDVHPSAYEKASLYTPVPGGVGPLTITMLLQNTLTAAKLRERNS
ncbi:MAG TPA: bifunctional 5,10-methylenetetrahydrofolate dehydrogenase/5,10-methenyltetrahydrofolate cyclohydrolase [Acidobacteriota bacterium]|nr:bifunctional 5,10-methylenetetrahydrofolate dehydrogenase/5,10-methenyltetrahydrofolate cyclohydrolase [Acidobacteriota bacterium]